MNQSKVRIISGSEELYFFTSLRSSSNNDVIDRDVDQLHEEANEAHDQETHAGCGADPDKLLHVWLCASVHEALGVLIEIIKTDFY